MRMRTLLAATAAGALLAGGMTGPAQAAVPPSPETLNAAGTPFTWGDDAAASSAIAMGEFDAPVVSVATNSSASTVNGGTTAAVTADGHFHIWGPNETLVLGAADLVADTTDAVAVALSPTSAYGALLHRDGTVSAWGAAAAPTFVSDLEDEELFPGGLKAKAIGVSAQGTGYAVKLDGTLAVWGASPAFTAGTPPPNLGDLVDIAVGDYQVLALKSDGTVVPWGMSDDDLGVEAGYNTLPDLGGKKVSQVIAGGTVNGLILEDGSIRVWGYNVPAGQPDLTGKSIVSLSFGSGSVGAVDSTGAVYTWGSRDYINDATKKAPLVGKPVSAISVSLYHAVAIITDFRKLTETTVSGVARPGQTLTATPATYNLTPTTTTGQWYEGETPTGTTDPTLTLDAGLAGKTVSYRTSAVRGDVTLTSNSAPVTVIDPATTPECKAAQATATGAQTAATAAATASAKAATKVTKAKKKLKKAKKHHASKAKIKKAKKKVKKAKQAVKKAATAQNSATATATSTAATAAAACR